MVALLSFKKKLVMVVLVVMTFGYKLGEKLQWGLPTPGPSELCCWSLGERVHPGPSAPGSPLLSVQRADFPSCFSFSHRLELAPFPSVSPVRF